MYEFGLGHGVEFREICHGVERRAWLHANMTSMPTPAEERPPIDYDVHTFDLPPLPQRDSLIPVERWIEAPDAARTLGADIGVTLVAYKRRIGDYLLWRAGPAVGADARYLAVNADDLDEQYTFRLYPDGTGVGLGPDGVSHPRFRSWKEALRDRSLDRSTDATTNDLTRTTDPGTDLVR
jgi:hypothetical protein